MVENSGVGDSNQNQNGGDANSQTVIDTTGLENPFSFLQDARKADELFQNHLKEIGSQSASNPDGANKDSGVASNDGNSQSATDGDNSNATADNANADPNALDLTGVDDNPFLAKIKDMNSGSAAQDIKDFDGAASLITSKTGIEIKEISDVPKLVDEFVKMKSDLDSLTDVKSRAEEFESIFSQMPQELFEAIKLWKSGKDHRSFLKDELGNALDFSKPYDKQDLRGLVNVYLPGRFAEVDDEDLKDKLEEIGVLKLIKDNFDKDQKSVLSRRDDEKKKQDERYKSYTQSVDVTMASINSLIPDSKYSAKQIDDVRDVLSRGTGGILSMFFNDDYTLKKDAAASVAFIKYGPSALAKLLDIVTKRAVSKTNEDIVTRGSDKRRDSGGGRNDGLSPEEVAKLEVAHMMGRK